MGTSVFIEPEFVSESDAARILAISSRSLVELVRRGELRAFRVPGMRRTVYWVMEIRALAAKWRQTPPLPASASERP
jgi:hypothetical protein